MGSRRIRYGIQLGFPKVQLTSSQREPEKWEIFFFRDEGNLIDVAVIMSRVCWEGLRLGEAFVVSQFTGKELSGKLFIFSIANK